MPAEQQKALVRRFIEDVWNQGDVAIIGQVCAPDFVLHDPTTPRFKTRLDYEQLVTTYRRAFPDLRCTIEEQLAERNLVMTWWGMQGTHRGPLFGYPPTERHVRFTGISLNLIRDGQIAEARVNWDALGLFQQLGILPNIGLGQELAQPVGAGVSMGPQMGQRP
jgi:steroid delta-isomerase-like uncharacterized protein